MELVSFWVFRLAMNGIKFCIFIFLCQRRLFLGLNINNNNLPKKPNPPPHPFFSMTMASSQIQAICISSHSLIVEIFDLFHKKSVIVVPNLSPRQIIQQFTQLTFLANSRSLHFKPSYSPFKFQTSVHLQDQNGNFGVQINSHKNRSKKSRRSKGIRRFNRRTKKKMNRSTKGSEQITTRKKIEQGRRSNRRIDPWGDNFPGLPVMAGSGWMSMWSPPLSLSPSLSLLCLMALLSWFVFLVWA